MFKAQATVKAPMSIVYNFCSDTRNYVQVDKRAAAIDLIEE